MNNLIYIIVLILFFLVSRKYRQENIVKNCKKYKKKDKKKKTCLKCNTGYTLSKNKKKCEEEDEDDEEDEEEDFGSVKFVNNASSRIQFTLNVSGEHFQTNVLAKGSSEDIKLTKKLPSSVKVVLDYENAGCRCQVYNVTGLTGKSTITMADGQYLQVSGGGSAGQQGYDTSIGCSNNITACMA